MILPFVIFIFILRNTVSSTCYFPQQIHGNYITERTSVSISSYQASSWGICQEYKNDNYILLLKSASQDIECFKCYHFNVVTENIILVYTEKGDKMHDRKCYPTVEGARKTCPKQTDIQNIRNNKQYHEMVLYKLLTAEATLNNRVPCPVNGRYKINYTPSNSASVKCVKSELDTCPSNSNMNLRFNECNENYEDIQYECLATWQGDDNTKFLALLDVGNSTQHAFKFRCAIYDEMDKNGVIKIIIGNGTACSWAKNRNTANANMIDMDDMPKETIIMYPAEEPPFPASLITCSFPDNLLGKWIHFEISKQFMLFRDADTQKTYKMGCVEKYRKPNRYLVYTRDQCLQTNFKCIWMEQRTPNIVEFKVSKISSDQYDIALCEDNTFGENWSTIVRLDNFPFKSACPISGNFYGVLPDEPSLCANLSSECISKGIMHYNVFTCSYGEDYDIRKYLCLGQWEHENLVYTFTKRIDMGRYECFVGTNISNNSMYIAELGENCLKGIDPNIIGMKMIKTDECPDAPKLAANSNGTELNHNGMRKLPTPTTKKPVPVTEAPMVAISNSAKLFSSRNFFYTHRIIIYILLIKLI